MIEGRIAQIEAYVREAMRQIATPDLRIGHDFKHVDRVRRWALQIARGEGFADVELVEATALLHDIGLAHVAERSQHAQVGAEVAARFLREQQLFADPEIDAIADAIRAHSSPVGAQPLGRILCDADKLDALGAVGLVRAFTSQYAKPEYDPRHIKGATWGLTLRDFEQRFAAGQGIGGCIVDQINFQISLADDLATETARRIVGPLVAFMREFMLELESEIGGARGDAR